MGKGEMRLKIMIALGSPLSSSPSPSALSWEAWGALTKTVYCDKHSCISFLLMILQEVSMFVTAGILQTGKLKLKDMKQISSSHIVSEPGSM